ncbi:MAG: type II toxin-antitoxin system VapC family toxin [Candidatus Woesearchaeota archaeon]|nr:type II toxin-antitoxin system VapC family toxin [Candidatus Woesearchaeota archaeon]
MVVFDTDVLIALLHGHDDARRAAHKYGGHDICITNFSWFELVKGALRTTKPKEKLAQLEQFFEGITVLPFDTADATAAGYAEATLAKKGRPIGIVDTFIAATCLVQKETLVTRNTKHFGKISELAVEKW